MSDAAEEYKPGLTELRLNAKSNLTNLGEVFRRVEVLKAAFDKLADQVHICNEQATRNEEEIRLLKAKLYENGIR